MHITDHTISVNSIQKQGTEWNEWRIPGVLLLLSYVFLIAFFWDTVRSLVDSWWVSRTFAHGFVVLPATCYLVWCYRPLWIHQVPTPDRWGLGALTLLTTGWILGAIAGVLWLQQAMVIAMIPGLAWAILGINIVKVLAWPFGFLVFMLPVGTSIEPWLQEFTAWFVKVGLRLAHIPYVSEDYNQIVITTGVWDVARDCGGLRYLLPGLALGTVFSMLIHRHPFHRWCFLVFCTGMLMIANGLRAYGVILVDYYGIADGTDHRLFSYTIYGLTIPFLFWIGLKWKERALTGSAEDRVNVQQGNFDLRKMVFTAFAAVLILAIGRLALIL